MKNVLLRFFNVTMNLYRKENEQNQGYVVHELGSRNFKRMKSSGIKNHIHLYPTFPDNKFHRPVSNPRVLYFRINEEF